MEAESRRGEAPIEPPPSRWRLPDPRRSSSDELIGIGADLEPGTLLAAYRTGLFPMPVDRGGMGWWSPDPRGVLPLDGLHVSRSLRRAVNRFETRVDTAFDAVVEACSRLPRPHGWISPEIIEAYQRLHSLGWAHSVETYAGGDLVGGLYGVAIGGLFAGESMFHTATDASKAALVRLVDVLADGDPVAAAAEGRLLDVQWRTDHLASLGAVALRRGRYLDALAASLRLPPSPRWPHRVMPSL